MCQPGSEQEVDFINNLLAIDAPGSMVCNWCSCVKAGWVVADGAMYGAF